MKHHFFDHDYSARNDQKVLMLRFKFGLEGYGAFWCLLESMAEDSTGYLDRGAMGGLSIGYGVAIGRLSEIIDYCLGIGLLSQCEHGKIFSGRMIKHKSRMDNLKENGKKGAEKRWKNGGANRVAIAPAMEGLMQKKLKETKRFFIFSIKFFVLSQKRQ